MAREPGPGVDIQGQAVVDPTENVKALNEAGIRRLDDLRMANEEKMQVEIEAVRREADLRAYYEGLLREKEEARIDAIRTVDTQAVQRAAEVQTEQATRLQTQVITTAEAFRATLTTALDPINTAIQDLRRAQYEAQGQKTQVIETRSSAEDMRPILDAITALTQAQERSLGHREQVVESKTDNRALFSVVATSIFLFIAMAGFIIQQAVAR
jgi:hypothetical protein